MKSLSHFTACWIIVVCSCAAVEADEVRWHFGTRYDLDDLNNVRNHFGLSGMGIIGDFTGDGVVDLDDLNRVRNTFRRPMISNMIRPEEPTTEDLIYFTLDHPAGAACRIDRDWGIPKLRVDLSRSAVEVYFVPPRPGVCGDTDSSIDGLEGTFGPLAAGEWTLGLEGQEPVLAFTVVDVPNQPVPEPGVWTLLLAAVALLPVFGRVASRRRAL